VSFDHRRAANAYRRQAVETAKPIDLVVMLYDGLLQSLDKAKDAIESRNLEEQNHHLLRAQRILSELSAGIDLDKGGEIGGNLMSLYAFCMARLIEANLQDTVEPVLQAKRVLAPLRDAWAEASRRIEEDTVAAS
jgi:flagellar protein FliS